MKNTIINRKVIKKIALALGELNELVVYVGGAVVSIYANDSAADDVRPTKDIDISMEIATLGELEKLREMLVKRGFTQNFEEDIMCRFRYEDIKVDVMATKEIGWAPANEWFKPGFEHLEEAVIDGQKIRVLSLPYFLATKFSAFNSRGNGEPRTSHDFEDITYILDNQTELVNLILLAPNEVNKFLKQQLNQIVRDNKMKEAILGNLFYETRDQRFELIIKKINTILKQ